MKAWQITGIGRPEAVLEIAERPLPLAAEGELGVEVHAAAVGLPDLLMCFGRYEFKPRHPFTPGQEVAGIVTDASRALPASSRASG